MPIIGPTRGDYSLQRANQASQAASQGFGRGMQNRQDQLLLEYRNRVQSEIERQNAIANWYKDLEQLRSSAPGKSYVLTALNNPEFMSHGLTLRGYSPEEQQALYEAIKENPIRWEEELAASLSGSRPGEKTEPGGQPPPPENDKITGQINVSQPKKGPENPLSWFMLRGNEEGSGTYTDTMEPSGGKGEPWALSPGETTQTETKETPGKGEPWALSPGETTQTETKETPEEGENRGWLDSMLEKGIDFKDLTPEERKDFSEAALIWSQYLKKKAFDRYMEILDQPMHRVFNTIRENFKRRKAEGETGHWIEKEGQEPMWVPWPRATIPVDIGKVIEEGKRPPPTRADEAQRQIDKREVVESMKDDYRFRSPTDIHAEKLTMRRYPPEVPPVNEAPVEEKEEPTPPVVEEVEETVEETVEEDFERKERLKQRIVENTNTSEEKASEIVEDGDDALKTINTWGEDIPIKEKKPTVNKAKRAFKVGIDTYGQLNKALKTPEGRKLLQDQVSKKLNNPEVYQAVALLNGRPEVAEEIRYRNTPEAKQLALAAAEAEKIAKNTEYQKALNKAEELRIDEKNIDFLKDELKYKEKNAKLEAQLKREGFAEDKADRILEYTKELRKALSTAATGNVVLKDAEVFPLWKQAVEVYEKSISDYGSAKAAQDEDPNFEAKRDVVTYYTNQMAKAMSGNKYQQKALSNYMNLYLSGEMPPAMRQAFILVIAGADGESVDTAAKKYGWELGEEIGWWFTRRHRDPILRSEEAETYEEFEARKSNEMVEPKKSEAEKALEAELGL